MKHAFLSAAAALALAVPAGVGIAQDSTGAHASHQGQAMSDANRAVYDAWPAERRAMYDAWPETYKSYFWTLSPDQMRGWWILTDDQRARVYAMAPEQRVAAWSTIIAQMNGAPAPGASAEASTAASTSGSADNSMASGSSSASMPGMSSGSMGTMASGQVQFVRKEVAQPVAGSADSAALQSGDLPVCKPNQQDGCINGWEKNRKGNKPLDHWPGRPASEMAGKKPAGK